MGSACLARIHGKTMNAATIDSTTLYYREGTSDKVYQTSIEPSGELFVVNFAFGRRGSTLNTGTKTMSPVDYPLGKVDLRQAGQGENGQGLHARRGRNALSAYV